MYLLRVAPSLEPRGCFSSVSLLCALRLSSVCAFVTRGAWILLRPTLLVRDLISVHILLLLFFFSSPWGLRFDERNDSRFATESGCISSGEVSFRRRKCQVFLLLCFRCFLCSGSGERRLQNTDRVLGTKLHSGIREWSHFL